MKMTRELLDEYLDHELTPELQAQVDTALAQDASAAVLLAQLKAQRQQRKELFATYEPTETEAHFGAQAVLREMHESRVTTIIGSIWAHRLARIAASVVLVAGAFAAGQYSVSFSNRIYSNPNSNQWLVEYTTADGQHVTQKFDTYTEAEKFAQGVAKNEPQTADIGGVF